MDRGAAWRFNLYRRSLAPTDQTNM